MHIGTASEEAIWGMLIVEVAGVSTGGEDGAAEGGENGAAEGVAGVAGGEATELAGLSFLLPNEAPLKPSFLSPSLRSLASLTAPLAFLMKSMLNVIC